MTCKACEDAAQREDNCGYSMHAHEIRSSCTHDGMVMVPRKMPQDFADWIAREIPPGTVISNPAWWAPKIYRAMLPAAPNVAPQEEKWRSMYLAKAKAPLGA